MTEIEQTVLDAIVDRIREINADIAHYEGRQSAGSKAWARSRGACPFAREKSFLLTISSQLELGFSHDRAYPG